MNKLLLITVLACTLCSATSNAHQLPGKSITKVQVCKRNKIAVRVSPVAAQKGSIKIVSTCTHPLHFYVFDLEGTLVSQAKVAPRQRAFIRNLPAGEFAYDVFMNDEGVEQGKISIR
ncbi:hypothetical protein SAMN05444008_109214 [Cnuella takakiae]|uniref:Por secretion system C-terminal sorting domain-containing protein n=1 Tax=Cnuella takakiae TaxID=1302690 RepID=A0A1M5CTY1_9BACT|nr:hypothetical protein [Cnuella takakiae]OLY91941.1 hypothetical protein BUE76_08570 [Cnuella takakiae]SHF58169.1 hypothetical protein SAMN05444008_109214 [Cnuella takakiae]